jgi:hypothetical protein
MTVLSKATVTLRLSNVRLAAIALSEISYEDRRRTTANKRAPHSSSIMGKSKSLCKLKR